MSITEPRDPGTCPVCGEPYEGGCHPCAGPPEDSDRSEKRTGDSLMTQDTHTGQLDLEAALRDATPAQVHLALDTLWDELAQRQLARRLLGDDPGLLATDVFFNDIGGIRDAAMARAVQLYGENAALRIEHIGRVTDGYSSKGRFRATVRIRCTNLADVWEPQP